MQKNVQIILSIALLFLGALKSVAQETNRGGGGFTIDGIGYEVLSFNPNEVRVFNATVTDEVIIPAIVTFQDVAYNVIAIGTNSFEGNTGLTSVTIPETVESISFSAFSNTGLTEVIALGTVPPTIQGNTFENRSAIALTVPDDLEDDYLSNGWTGFASINGTNLNFEVNNITYSLNSLIANTVSVTGSSITGSGLTIPANVTFNSTNYTVTEIAAGAFENNQLTSVSLPSTLAKIGSFAFRNNQLTSVIIPNTVTEIPQSTFRDNQLATITLPNTMTSIGENAFRNNQLTSINIPTGITIIDRNVFRDNNLSSITIPDGVTEIDIFAFYENNLTTITIPASVTNIGSFAFSNSPLDEVISLATIPPAIGNPEFIFGNFETVNTIDLTVPTGTETAYANAGWIGFRSVNGVVNPAVGVAFIENNFDYVITSLSPNEVEITGGTNVPQDLVIDATVNALGTSFSVVQVAQSAFTNKNLTSVQLPNTLRVIRNFAFENNQITSLTIPPSVTRLDFRAFRLNQIGGDLVIPNTVTVLGNGVFELNNLTSVTISENISAIQAQTFRSNQLTTVTIPANVNSLGNSCFRNNPLTEVIVENTTPPNINSGNGDSFLNIRGNIALTVPTNTELNYLVNGWTGFASINGQDPAVFNEFETDNITYRITKLNPNEVTAIGATITGELVLSNTVSNTTENFTVKSIGANTFRNKQLTTVTIPASVTSIGARAFRDNPLKTFILENTAAPTINNQTNSNNTFNNRHTIEVFVPAGSGQTYLGNGWTGFKSLIGVSKSLLLKVYLQGASLHPFTGEENLMRDDLRLAGLIPAISPYEDTLAIFDTIYVAQTEGPDAIVDWIYIELRDRSNSNTIIEGKSALLQRDGDIVGPDAITPVQFTAPIDDYFVTIKHRNHLGMMTLNTKTLPVVASTLDFTDATNPITFGSNAQTDAGMPSNTLGMWSGNTNGDSIIQYSGTNPDAPIILSFVLNDPSNFLNFSTFIVNGYDINDLNLDGNIQYVGVSPDAPFILQNVLAHPGNFLNFSTFQIQEQLPEN